MSKARLKEVPLVYVVEGQRKGGRWHVSAVHEQKQDAVDGACRTVLAGYYDMHNTALAKGSRKGWWLKGLKKPRSDARDHQQSTWRTTRRKDT